MLVALIVLLIAMLAGVVGKDAFAPGDWRHHFKVGLGLDLSSGTEVTLRAVTPNHKQPSQSAMNTAISIINARVNGAGFNNASVVQQGPNIIVVSVPGEGAEKVVNLVGATALLRFRQVLLVAPNTTSPTTTPTPTPSPSATPTPSPSTSPSPSASPTPSPSPSPSSSSTTPKLSTTADGAGDAGALTAKTKAEFDKLNCSLADWRAKIYGDNSNNWDDVKSQTVSCFHGYKYALATAPVTGTMVSSATPALDTTSNAWQVNLTFNGQGTKLFGDLTSMMYDKYAGSDTNPLNEFAIVMDGYIVSTPYVSTAITTGTGQISDIGSENEANYLANELTYGHLPLSFQREAIQSVSAQLGTSQLHAGLIAAMVGLALVVCYSFLYYRGLGVVSVSSLAIAALLAYLSVVLLSEYYAFTLTLAGIAGLIVAIGITADSFVVFFERLRDEVREGRSLRPAVERGWHRARRTIIVSDTVSFLAAALLYFFAIGDVRGFAFTLGLTTVIDIVVVFLFTKPMVSLLARTEFYGSGHRLSGLDPARLGARSPWRGTRRTPRPSEKEA
jgi:preprotein translocase subunit SecD